MYVKAEDTHKTMFREKNTPLLVTECNELTELTQLVDGESRFEMLIFLLRRMRLCNGESFHRKV